MGGVADLNGWSSFSRPVADIMAHELGHNLSLRHAPCGSPRSLDPWFPHSGGSIGAWGYDFERNALVPPQTADLMGYCVLPNWISDFFFNKALDRRLAEDGATAAAIAAAADPVRTLLLWGGRDEDGVPYLDPAFVVDAVPSIPTTSGEYTIEGATADGTPIFSFYFDMPTIADGEGEETSFVFALPVQSHWANDLASITLSRPGWLGRTGRSHGPADGHPSRPAKRRGARIPAGSGSRGDPGRGGRGGRCRRSGDGNAVQPRHPRCGGVEAMKECQV